MEWIKTVTIGGVTELKAIVDGYQLTVWGRTDELWWMWQVTTPEKIRIIAPCGGCDLSVEELMRQCESAYQKWKGGE